MASVSPAERALLIAGQAMTFDRHSEIRSPETGEVVALVPLCNPPQGEAAVPGERRGFEPPRGWPRHRRRDLCARIADGIVGRAAGLAEAIRAESGKPIALAQAEVGRAEL